jgi:hypothetical protein
MRVDWPAQPYLNLAQNYFSRSSVFVVLCQLESAEPVGERAANATFEVLPRRVS